MKFELTKTEIYQELISWVLFGVMMLPENVLLQFITREWDMRLTVLSVLVSVYFSLRNKVLRRIFREFNGD